MYKNIFAITHLIMMKAQDAGNLVFEGHHPSPEEIRIQMEATKMAHRIADVLKTCKDEDILPLAECFDNVYRIGYQQSPDRTYISSLYRQSFESWKSGNRNIAESSVFAMIAPRISNPRAIVNPEERQTYHDILHRWVDTMDRYGRFPNATSYENFMRISLLTQPAIRRYYQNPAEVRRRWYEKNEVENFEELSSLILKAYRRFISSMCSDVLTYEEYLTIDNRILHELIHRRDLSPYDREAYRLALRFNEKQLLSRRKMHNA